jgi:hypothetical protein
VTREGRLAGNARAAWMDRHSSATLASQTRAPQPGSVPAEGGGPATPTLGRGIGFSREQVPVAGEVAR